MQNEEHREASPSVMPDLKTRLARANGGQVTVKSRSDAQFEWGWTSYRRVGWLVEQDDGVVRRCYRAKVRSQATRISTELTWEERTIVFYAQRPILALREITNSSKDPLEFDGQRIH